MTIMTNRNEIANQSIFPIAINMMNDKHSFIGNIAVVTLLIKYFPGVLPIATRHLGFKRFSIPVFYKTFSRTINTSILSLLKPRVSNKKIYRTFNAYSFYLNRFFPRNFKVTLNCFHGINGRCAFPRAISLRLSGMFFANKINFAKFTNICNYWFASIYATTFMTTSYMPRFMASIYDKLTATNRTNFSNFFHTRIVS